MQEYSNNRLMICVWIDISSGYKIEKRGVFAIHVMKFQSIQHSDVGMCSIAFKFIVLYSQLFRLSWTQAQTHRCMTSFYGIKNTTTEQLKQHDKNKTNSHSTKRNTKNYRNSNQALVLRVRLAAHTNTPNRNVLVLVAA